MALARLITRTPEYAQQLASSLAAAGYTVEFASPEEHSSSAADLEVNLDDPSAASSYIITADGREISFSYDPLEREFVLAPLWRNVAATFTLLREKFRKPAPVAESVTRPFEVRTEPELSPAVEEAALAEVRSVQAEIVPAPVLESAKPEPIDAPLFQAPCAEPLIQSLYLPPVEAAVEAQSESIMFSGVEYFDGHGVRRTTPETTPHETLAEVETTTPQPEISRPTTTAWHVHAAAAANSLRQQVHERWASARAQASAGNRRLREYDLAWMRAVPAAAVITLAFLLGWGLSSRPELVKTSPTQTATTPVQEAAVAPLPAAVVVPKLKPAALKPPPKVAAAKKVRYDDEEEAEDVVVRHYPKHYPSKSVQAANQKTVRKYSDIE